MNKPLYILIAFLFLAGCGAKKKTIQTTKTPTKITKPVTNTPKKPENKPQQTTQNTTTTEVLAATSKVKVTTQLVNEYIDKYKEVAKTNMQNHGVPASIALAQAILESGAGTGSLCIKANNHFGIKCHEDWQGESVRFDDDAPQECFRKYDTALASYQDYAQFLIGRKWYIPLFKLEKNDYKGWAKGLKKAGYATDSKYPEKLISIIERYKLYNYDAQVLGTEPTYIEETKQNPTPQTTNQTHIVAQGDTLYSISKKYNTTIEQLKSKNNITNNAISIGQTIVIP